MINALVWWRRLREKGKSERMHKYEKMKEDQKRGGGRKRKENSTREGERLRERVCERE